MAPREVAPAARCGATASTLRPASGRAPLRTTSRHGAGRSRASGGAPSPRGSAPPAGSATPRPRPLRRWSRRLATIAPGSAQTGASDIRAGSSARISRYSGLLFRERDERFAPTMSRSWVWPGITSHRCRPAPPSVTSARPARLWNSPVGEPRCDKVTRDHDPAFGPQIGEQSARGPRSEFEVGEAAEVQVREVQQLDGSRLGPGTVIGERWPLRFGPGPGIRKPHLGGGELLRPHTALGFHAPTPENGPSRHVHRHRPADFRVRDRGLCRTP